MSEPTTKKRLDLNSKVFAVLLAKYYSYVLLLFLAAIIGFGLYMGYATLFDTLVVQKTINPADIKSKEEKIDITRYTNVSRLLDEKITHEAPKISGTTF